MSKPSAILPWQRAWSASRDDPWLFVTGVLGVLPYGAPNPTKAPQLEQWQEEELRNVVPKRRLSIRSGHGCGKSAFLAWIVLWGLCCHDDVKIPVASNSQDQLRDIIWPEIKKWWRFLPEPLREQVDVQAERIVIKAAPDSAFAVRRTASKDNSEALQGFHAGLVIFLIDEASGIAEIIFEVAMGAMSGENAITILTGNPTRARGFFHATHTTLRRRWHARRVNSEDVPRARGHIGDVIATYGQDSNRYRVRVLGEFPSRDDDTVIPLELIEPAKDRQVVMSHVYPVWGLDVARFGDDRTVLVKRQGNTLLGPPIVWQQLDMRQITARVAAEYAKTPLEDRPRAICVDVIGYGAGVVDFLRDDGQIADDGVNIVGVNVAEAPSTDAENYKLRDELWFFARAWFAARDCTIPTVNLNSEQRAAIEELIAELATPTFDFTVGGKRVVASKKDIKKDLGRSCDIADAFNMTFAVSPYPRPSEDADRHRARRWDHHEADPLAA
jgi:hypothetical protein